MFTGIVETVGDVRSLKKGPAGNVSLVVESRKQLGKVRRGQSISVNGVCLTAMRAFSKRMVFDVVPETLCVSNLGKLREGALVNLERSLKWGDRLDGHYVLGHVEAMVRLLGIRRSARGVEFNLSKPQGLARFIVPKGSVALNGVSLTAGRVRSGSFTVYLIPHTLKSTNLGSMKKGSFLNIETDIMLNACP